MDSITLDDILDSFSSIADQDDEKYLKVEEEYKEKHDVLGYYNIVMPYLYRSELKPGIIIRYSGKFDKISCASRIIAIDYSLDQKSIKKLRLVAVNKKDDSDVWHIFPELYYIFKYNPNVTKLRRDLYKIGITNLNSVKDPENYDKLKQNINLSKASEEKNSKKPKASRRYTSKGQSSKSTKEPRNNPLSSLPNPNRLDFSALIKSDPSIKDRIIRTRPTTDETEGSEPVYDLNPARRHNPRVRHQRTQNAPKRKIKYEEDDPYYSKIKNMKSLLESDSE